MSIHLMCLTSDGGVPIYSKKRGDCENLPFSTVASLNGVHMFCKSQNVDLSVTYFDDGIIVWKEFDSTIMMIGIAKGITEKVLRKLLEYSYNAMIFCVGFSSVKKIKNIDRFKRELKNCYPIIDQLLEVAEMDFFQFNDCILCAENLNLLIKLNEFSTQMGSPFCALIVRQKLACATEGWWDLDIVDRKLLMVLLNASNTIQQDVPIFLPKKSPGIAYRFICIPLTQNISFCTLCGAEPSYNELENLTQQFWMTEVDILLSAEQSHPRNFPASLELDPGILGFLLMNKDTSKCVISRNIHQTSAGKRTLSGTHRLDILRTFFHQTVDSSDQLSKDNPSILNLEQYWCSDYHKCHALIEDQNILCVLYISAIPTHLMRIITQKTLNMLLSEKDICW